MKIIKNIQIQSKEGLPILIDVCYKETNLPKPVIIFSHGFRSFKDWGTFNLLAKSFADSGFVFVKFNFSHNGTTPDHPDEIVSPELFGSTNITNELDDIDSVITWVQDNAFLVNIYMIKEEIYLLGHSRGATLSILQGAVDERVKKIVSWCAFSDFEKIWANFDIKKWAEEGVSWSESKSSGIKLPLYYQHYENYLLNKEKYNIKKAVSSLKIPLFLVHGMEDETIGYEQTLEMKSWNKNADFSLLPNTNHNLGGYHPYAQTYLPFDTRVAVKESIAFFRGELA
jgi:uncharacterized protein